MKFSVIIPCYNCVKTLEKTVHSIRLSGLTDYEILLIDDGSSDGTEALCDELCKLHAEIRCIHQQNSGVSAARNRGIDEAQGDYIWFVDADDMVDSLSLAAADDVIVTQQPDMLMFGMSFDYYRKGKLYRREKLCPPYSGKITAEQLKRDFRIFYDCNALTPIWNKICRRKILIDSGVRFCEEMHLMEDFLFVLELLPYCANICCINDAIYRYCQGEDEKGAYRRLKRISDLAAYIKPFEQNIARLDIPDGDKLGDDFYLMLLRQKMQYSGLNDIRRTIRTHENGSRASMNLKLNPIRIYLNNRMILFKHQLAVTVKSSALYQKLKAVH